MWQSAIVFPFATCSIYVPWPNFASELGVNDVVGIKNSVVQIPVIAYNTNKVTSNITFGIHYNKTILGFKGANLGELTSNWNSPSVDNNFDWGTLVTIVYNENPIDINLTGSIAELEFNVIGEPTQTSDINFYDLNELPEHCADRHCGIQFFNVNETGFLFDGTSVPKNGKFTVGISGVTNIRIQ